MLFLVPAILGCHWIDTFLVSQGGVGSSAFFARLRRANVTTNDVNDSDGVKHAFPDRFSFGKTIAIGPYCSHSAIVVVGGIEHAIASTVRRFKMRHINKLRKQAKMNPISLATFKRLGVLQVAESGMPQFQQAWRKQKYANVKVLTTAELYHSDVLGWVRRYGAEGL